MPFALLGAVALLSVAALGGLAAAALAADRRGAELLVATGALVLAGVDAATALQLGSPRSDLLTAGRGVALLVLAGGLALGGLSRRRERAGLPLLGVIVPLASGVGPAVLAGTAGLIAAAAALRVRRDAAALWLAAGLALTGLSSYAGASAGRGSTGPTVVLGLQGAGTLAVLFALSVLARTSLLAKVVTAILAGVLVMAVAAVAVVGTVVVTAYEKQNRSLVEQAAQGRREALDTLADRATSVLPLVRAGCTAAERCGRLLAALDLRGHDFVVRVRRTGAPVALAGRPGLSRSEVLGLRGVAPVVDVLQGVGSQKVTTSVQSVVRLTGSPAGVAVVAVAPGARPDPQGPPLDALVYGVRVDDAYTADDVERRGYGLSLLGGQPLAVLASNRSGDERAELLAIAREAGLERALPDTGRTLGTQGTRPSVRFLPLVDNDGRPVALLAVSREATSVIGTERDALRLLLLTTLLATALVAAVAFVLGRRTVDPLRRLTAAAERVSRGDLDGAELIGGPDEVGTLSRTFGAMTGNLARVTGDLRSTAGRLTTVLSSMSDGLLATDGEGLVTSVNPAALAMLGLPEDAVLGRFVHEVADVRAASGLALDDPALRLGDEPATVHRADGSTVPVRLAASDLEGGEGLVLVLRDTTREREVERMKTEFLSNVSHELRTPLTPIRGYAEILVAKPGLDPDSVISFATTIRDESMKMNRVVDLLVDVAALEAGRASVAPRPVSVTDLLEGRVEAWARRAPSRPLTRRVAARLPPVLVDPSWLGKALDELIDNAVKYTPDGTVITLVARRAQVPGRVRVAVRDAGPGIAPSDQRLLFTSFEQVDGSATRRVGGLGLGLSFVRRVADDAGIALTVSSAVGKGSEFALDLPVADEPVQSSVASRASARPGTRSLPPTRSSSPPA